MFCCLLHVHLFCKGLPFESSIKLDAYFNTGKSKHQHFMLTNYIISAQLLMITTRWSRYVTINIYVHVFICCMKEKVFSLYKNDKVVLAKDGRCDSPGSSAKYCSYIIMDVTNNTILQMITVDKWQVSLYSPNMEREAPRQSLDQLCNY